MNDKQFATAMETIVAALKERGYDPYTYITNHKGARQLIITLDMECVKRYVKEMR